MWGNCRRKKDHGRAEALLIAAWALGVRAPKDVAAEKSLADETRPIDVATTDSSVADSSEKFSSPGTVRNLVVTESGAIVSAEEVAVGSV